jgi:hypothetical protein
MPLQLTGASVPNMTGGKNYQAANQNGEMIFVEISEEVMMNHTLDALERIASNKYDQGDLVDGTVVVHSEDFSESKDDI